MPSTPSININTLIKIADTMSDEEATLVVTAGTAMYGLTELGGLVAGESVVVIGPGPIGLLGVAVAKALGADPVILTGTREQRCGQGRELGADHVVNVTSRMRSPPCGGSPAARASTTCWNVRVPRTPSTCALKVLNRGGKLCLAAFPHTPVSVDVAHLVRNNIYLYGIRGEGRSATHRAEAFMRRKQFDACKIHTHTFQLDELPEALRYARDRVEDAIKVVVKTRPGAAAGRAAAE